MIDLQGQIVLASITRNIGFLIAVLVTIAMIVYLVLQARVAKPEIGSEVELAPNRKKYHEDEVLEGSVLNRNLFIGLGLIAVVAVALPVYWLQEPSRIVNADGNFDRISTDRGEEQFLPSAEGGLGCADCHGGMEATGGSAEFVLTDANGDFVETVDWKAPALNQLMTRYDEDEIREILVYGRTFSPMPAWGIEGNGPLNEQQIGDLIAYIDSIQLRGDELDAELVAFGEEVQRSLDDGEFESEGEAVFNAGQESGFAGGAYACARCHTAGWSYGQPDIAGGGAYGPNLRNIETQFPGGAGGFTEHLEFVTNGSMNGQVYGQQGLGSGGMPAFGGMYSEDQLRAVVDYERNLG
jgi:mono/diheme cytochrome c family protein